MSCAPPSRRVWAFISFALLGLALQAVSFSAVNGCLGLLAKDEARSFFSLFALGGLVAAFILSAVFLLFLLGGGLVVPRRSLAVRSLVFVAITVTWTFWASQYPELNWW
jgi:hypothetical protein